MKHSLQLRLSQHLTLTPQLQQSIRLLQLSTQELNSELERFLQENPLLERDEGPSEATPPMVGANGSSATTEREGESNAPAADDTPAAHSDGDLFASGHDAPYGNGSCEDGDDDDYPQLAAESPTLRDHLIGQLSLTN